MYQLYAIAEHLNVPPWELAEQPAFYLEFAKTYLSVNEDVAVARRRMEN